MKKIFIILAAFSFAALHSYNANAQVLEGSGKIKTEEATETAPTVKLFDPEMVLLHKGDQMINASLGIVTFSYDIPFISASYENIVYQIDKNLCLGVGATLGITGLKDSYYEMYMVYGIYALANMHYTVSDKLDLYTGLDLGGVFSKYKSVSSIISSSVYPVHIGANYFFSEKLAARVLLGGWGGLSIGIAAKF